MIPLPDGGPQKGAGPTCCTTFYEQDWVRALADDMFHPGGAALTRRTVSGMGLPRAARLLDLGSGTGSSARLVAGDFGLDVVGLDRSPVNVARAAARCTETSAALRFTCADAADLPFADAAFDGALAECTFSLFPDQGAVLAELRRVLRPGGALGVTDMAVGARLPSDVEEVLAPWTCLADAVDESRYREVFGAGGFEVREAADESWGLRELLLRLKRKLLVAGAGQMLGEAVPPHLDLAAVRHWLDRLRDLVREGTIRYLRFQLTRPD
jgi:SAM-dependent methyltransferase